MLFRTLKEDLKRKKTMNIIVFLFIGLAAMFLASSVTDMLIVFRGVDYYLDKSNVSDYVALASGATKNSEEITDWLSNCDIVEAYDVDDSIVTGSDSMSIMKDGKVINYKQTNPSALQVQPEKYARVFDEDGNLIELAPGEIAVPLIDKDQNDIEIGDKLSVEVEHITKEFTVAYFTKDAVCGTTFMGFKRFLISGEDYEDLTKQEGIIYQTWYMIDTNHLNSFQKSLKAQNFNILFSFQRDTVKICYMTDMMIAGILLIVSVCLILISFFVLRFTIVFTIQEDYKDIGVMKAIGIKNLGIKSIYLIKYLVLAITASVLGLGASFPFAKMLINQVSANMLMGDTSQNPLINAGCSILVILLVVFFCYTSMKKLDKYSAIEAIRNGSSGERFKRNSVIKLKNHAKMHASMFIAFNDILTSFRKYAVMIVTFCLGAMLIIIPVNSMNTLKDSNLVKMFGYNRSDFYMSNVFDSNIMSENGKEKAQDIMDRMTKEMEEASIPAKLFVELYFTLSIHGEEKDDIYSVGVGQNFNGDTFHYDYLEGSHPVLENEIALSEKSADYMKVGIGDFVYAMIEGEEKEFLVTGLYQSMSNLGVNARLNNIINLSFQNLSGAGYLQGDFIGEDKDVKEYREILMGLYPDHKVLDAEQYVSTMVGGIVEQIDTFKNLIVMLVLCMDGLITILMVKSFVTKETAEIAMLKSIGFRSKSLRNIQIIRIGMVQAVSVLLGVLLSILLDDYTIGYVFKFMGAKHIQLTIVPQEIYVLYPILLFVVPMLVAWLSSYMIGKISIKEMNCEE